MANDIIDQLSKLDDRSVDNATPPSEKVVDFLHARADFQSATAIHHRMGFSHYDVNYGDHKHENGDSSPLWAAGSQDFTQIPAGSTLAQAVTKINLLSAALAMKQF